MEEEVEESKKNLDVKKTEKVEEQKPTIIP